MAYRLWLLPVSHSQRSLSLLYSSQSVALACYTAVRLLA